MSEIVRHRRPADQRRGGGLTWVAIGAMAGAAKQIRDEGDFSAQLAATRPFDEWLGSA